MCGIVGTINVENSTEAIRMMLHALQNRGQQAAGIVTLDGTKKHEYRAPGTVIEFPLEELDSLVGNIGIGHNRYATAANSSGPKNMQPFLMTVDNEPIAIAHNGNFTNTQTLREEELKGVPFVSESDTEVFFRLLLRAWRSGSFEDSVIKTLAQVQGSCSAVVALPGRLIAIRDSTGNRPLFWGRSGDGYVVASENCALDAIGVFIWHEVAPGTIVTFTDDGQVIVSKEFGDGKRRFCPFELIYFAQITSTIYGIPIANIRESFGQELALEHPVEADIILGVPDSGTLSAVGYSQKNQSGTFDLALAMRRHNTGRSFTRSGQAKRERVVADKFAFATEKIRGKRAVVVDDSLVRGTTSTSITEQLRNRGATEVHWRIPSPPVTGPCHYGIATKAGELLATDHSVEEMRDIIGADSLEFLSLGAFKRVIASYGVSPDDCCFGCIDGNYWHTS